MLHYKDSVDISFVQPQVIFGVMLADQVFGQSGIPETWITSICDNDPGRKPNSLHKSGLAFDLRLPFQQIPGQLGQHPRTIQCYNLLKLRLGPAWDVVLEIDHIHCEYQPKHVGTEASYKIKK